MTLDLDAALAAARIVPVLTVSSPATAAPLADALAEAGIQCAEVTFRTRDAEKVLAVMSAHGGLTVGAGTVLSPEQAERAVDAGAAFVVSPGIDTDILARCRELAVPAAPGIATATELMVALAAGTATVKLFPAEQLGGLSILKALAAPFPQARFMPTGGISLESAGEYLAHPAVLAVGGSWIAPPVLLESGNYREITRRAAEALERSIP